MTFCPDVPTKAADNVQLLRLPNLQLPLYTHSFLGFGQEAALTLASTAAVSKRLQENTASPNPIGTGLHTITVVDANATPSLQHWHWLHVHRKLRALHINEPSLLRLLSQCHARLHYHKPCTD